MSSFTKLFSDIVRSTVWREKDHVRLVWITMLAITDKTGYVSSSLPGLADTARVTIEQCQQALKILSSPDEWSRSQEYEGRRIEAVDGGWRILNYLKYRNRFSVEDRREYKRVKQREYRQRAKEPARHVVQAAIKPEVARDRRAVAKLPRPLPLPATEQTKENDEWQRVEMKESAVADQEAAEQMEGELEAEEQIDPEDYR